MTGTPLTVAVLSGGRSSEHDVSLSSGRAVSAGLREAGHTVLEVLAQRDGGWSHDGQALALSAGGGLLGADVAFPVLHGRYGEDGTVQGMFELLDVAYVGAGVLASALCLDKVVFKAQMAAAGVPQVRYAAVREDDWVADRASLLAQLAALGTPVFVKPARMGSSVGIARVAHAGELSDAMQEAFAHDPLVIVEAAAQGLEIECSVVGLTSGQRTPGGPGEFASRPGEIVLAKPGWYDYEAKYSDGAMSLVVPARISPSATERVRELAIEAFRRSGCEGLARVDFFVDGEQVLVNELNTMPGFTPTSVYAKLLEASGVPYSQLVDRLCRLGIERHARQSAHRF
jgi:D-alanine-D-alanine ligase